MRPLVLFLYVRACGGCTVSLKLQDSKKACVSDVSFGCYQGSDRMWISKGCRGAFICNGRSVWCGTSMSHLRAIIPGSPVQRNCTCTDRERVGDYAAGGNMPLQPTLAATRLNNDVPYGEPRFKPASFDEALHATFTWWDLLDATMHAWTPQQLYATGYVREIQLRRMIELAREPSVRTYCEVGMNGGHSTVAMLLANPTLTVHTFDLMAWPYSEPVAKLLKLRFGNRFVLHAGSSHETLGPWASRCLPMSTHMPWSRLPTSAAHAFACVQPASCTYTCTHAHAAALTVLLATVPAVTCCSLMGITRRVGRTMISVTCVHTEWCTTCTPHAAAWQSCIP